MKNKVEQITTEQFLCAEGPVWDSRKELIYWTECVGDCIYSYNPGEGSVHLHHRGMTAASLVLHQQGGLIISGKDGFSLLTPEKKIQALKNEADGVAINNLNDIIADPHGRVFGGQESFSEEMKYETGYLFRLDSNGNSKIVADGLHLSNGMGFSPDCTKFYLVDTILRNVYQFDYDVSSGDIHNQKILIQFDKEHGMPDGMTVDAQGFLWIAMFFGSKIIRLDPEGVIEREVNLPCTQPTSVAFGGKNMNELFITSGAIEWNTRHAFPPPNYKIAGGYIYRIETDFQGKAEFPARI